MAIKLKHSSAYSTYFCTFTCFNWINLIDIVKAYDLIYKWFNYLKENSNGNVLSYVIMPNHVHCILYFSNGQFELNKILGNAERFIAYEIVERLKAQNNLPILKILKEGLSERERRKGQLHKVFEESFDAKPIFSNKFLLQKINRYRRLRIPNVIPMDYKA